MSDIRPSPQNGLTSIWLPIEEEEIVKSRFFGRNTLIPSETQEDKFQIVILKYGYIGVDNN